MRKTFYNADVDFTPLRHLEVVEIHETGTVLMGSPMPIFIVKEVKFFYSDINLHRSYK